MITMLMYSTVCFLLLPPLALHSISSSRGNKEPAIVFSFISVIYNISGVLLSQVMILTPYFLPELKVLAWNLVSLYYFQNQYVKFASKFLLKYIYISAFLNLHVWSQAMCISSLSLSKDTSLIFLLHAPFSNPDSTARKHCFQVITLQLNLSLS